MNLKLEFLEKFAFVGAITLVLIIFGLIIYILNFT